jgi:phosphate transport system permease protein
MDRYRRKPVELLIVLMLFLAASVAMATVIAITIYIWRQGWPVLAKVGPLHFLFGRDWQPASGIYGVLPQLAGSIYVTFGALALGVPFGVFGALFLAEFAPKRVADILHPVISLLAAVPSVVYGFVALRLLVPLLQAPTGGLGLSLLAGAIVLAIMILPTIISISEDAIRAVPLDYKEASLGLGATHWQTSWRVLLPAARSGIIASVILGAGRAIGETMAVMMVIGNMFMVPKSILQPGATLTGTIALEFSYAGPEHLQALFAVGIVLFVFIMLTNAMAQIIARMGGKKAGR